MWGQAAGPGLSEAGGKAGIVRSAQAARAQRWGPKWGPWAPVCEQTPACALFTSGPGAGLGWAGAQPGGGRPTQLLPWGRPHPSAHLGTGAGPRTSGLLQFFLVSSGAAEGHASSWEPSAVTRSPPCTGAGAGTPPHPAPTVGGSARCPQAPAEPPAVRTQ